MRKSLLLILLGFWATGWLHGQGAVRLYNEALDYYLDEAYPQAREHVRLALKIQKTYPDAWFLLGQVYRQEGRFRKAIRHYNKALKLTPTEPEYLFHKAVAYEQAGKLKKAIGQYLETTRVDPKYAYAWDRLGDLYYEAKAWEAAAEYYSGSIDANPLRPEVYLWRSRAHFEMEAFGRALSDCDQALGLDAELEEAYFRRGQIHFHRGDLLGAVKDYSQVLERSPDNIDALLNRGVALLVLELYPQSRDDLTQAIQLDSSLANAWWNRAIWNLEQDSLYAARRDIAVATDLAPRDPETWLLAGRIAFRQRDYRAAIQAYDRCLSLDRRYAEAYLNRGEAKRVLDDLKGACKDWEMVLKYDSGVHADKAQSWILINCE